MNVPVVAHHQDVFVTVVGSDGKTSRQIRRRPICFGEGAGPINTNTIYLLTVLSTLGHVPITIPRCQQGHKVGRSARTKPFVSGIETTKRKKK